jgi:hypothetical protein
MECFKIIQSIVRVKHYMLCNFFCGQIQTVKIDKFYFSEMKNALNSRGMCSLEITMKNGSTRHAECEPGYAFKKYKDIFDNPIDQNYNHNQKIIYDNHLVNLFNKDVIPMHENPQSESKCSIS